MEMVNNHRKFEHKHEIEYCLLYRASRDGFGRDEFFEKCDQKKNTLCMIQSRENNVFGGYTSLMWDEQKRGGYEADPDAFLYLIRSNQGLKPKIFPIQHNGTRALEQDDSYILAFGGYGYGFWLQTGYEIRGHATQRKCIEFAVNAHTFNGAKDPFGVSDIEVFQLA